MMSLGVFLAALMLTGDIAGCYGHSGLRVTVPEALLQQINTIEVGEIKRNVSELRILDISQSGDLSFRISAFRISNVGETTSTLNLQPGNTIHWTVDLSSLTLVAHWWVKYSAFGFSTELSGSLPVTAPSTSLSLEVSLGTSNGHLTISLAKCTIVIGDLNLRFEGLLADVVNLIKDPIENSIKDQLEREICNLVRGVLGNLAKTMGNINTQYEINFLGIPLTLDNQFTNITTNSHSATTYQKGAVKWIDKYIETKTTLPALPVTSDRLAFDIAQDTINNLLEAVITSGSLNNNISYAYIMDNKITELYFDDCQGVCAGLILRDKVPGYPNGVLGMKWTVTDAHLKILPEALLATIKVIVNFTAETAHQQEHLFGAHLMLSVPFQAQMSQDGLHIRPAAVGGTFTIDSSNIGKILDPELQDLINIVAVGEMQKKMISMFEDFDTIIPIQLPPKVTFRRNSVSFHEGVLRVEADICYKQVCKYETNDVWIGKTTTGNLKIIDVLPTEVTSTATTTTESQHGGQSSLSSSEKLLVLSLSIALFRRMILVLC